jgi:hypothetical protein
MAVDRRAAARRVGLRGATALMLGWAALAPHPAAAQTCSSMTGLQRSKVAYSVFKVAVADFNGDGIPDAVTAGAADSQSIAVALGLGTGRFGPPTTYPASGYPNGVATGDLNQDGRADIVATANSPAEVLVLLGNGNGTFTSTHVPVPASALSALVVGDFDGDGRDDVAVNRFAATSSVSVLLSAPGGTLGAPIDSVIEAITISAMVARDLNGDHVADLVVGKFNEKLSVLIASGDGHFEPEVNYGVGTASGIALADFDEDSREDVAITLDNPPRLAVLQGNGDGTFGPAANVDLTGAEGVGAADFNGDGHTDIVTVGEKGTLVYLGVGTGAFHGGAAYPGPSEPRVVALADLDHDGDVDLVMSDYRAGNLVTYLNGGCWRLQRLEVTRLGSGIGTVTSFPPGTDCGDTCAQQYVEGTVVTLFAAPAPGSGLVRWGGECSGSGARCSLTMNGPHAATATFEPLLPPAVDQLVPESGTIGVTVTIGGANLAWVTSLDFNGTLAPFVIESGTTIRARVPSGASTGRVRVTSRYGSAASPADFTVTRAPVWRVTTTADSGPGSLRAAIEAANASEGLDYVRFRIPGEGIHDIVVLSPLDITELTVVDGGTQPGYAGAPRIYVEGNGAVSDVFRLSGNSSGSTLQGLGITAFLGSGILVAPGSQGNWIQENWVGFRRDDEGGTILNSSTVIGSRGISVQSGANTVRLNAVSGVQDGIVLGDDLSTATAIRTNAIHYNSIGTDPWGSTAAGYGNQGSGIVFGPRARETFVGPGNVISGNAGTGITMYNASNVGSAVFANKIGVDLYGDHVIGNGQYGVAIAGGARSNSIGADYGGNVIAGNRLAGVVLGTTAGGGAGETFVANNIIGMNAGQSYGLPGQRFGVEIAAGSARSPVRANAIGGSLNDGVHIANSPVSLVYQNWIGRSAFGIAIQNWGYGVRIVNSANTTAGGNAFGTNVKGNTLFVNSPGTNTAPASAPLEVPEAMTIPARQPSGAMVLRGERLRRE